MADSTDTRRNRIAAMFEILTREADPKRPGEQNNALSRLLAVDPTREFISEAIAYVRDPEDVIGDAIKDALKAAGRGGDKFDEAERFLLQSKLNHVQWQLDFHVKHEKQYVTPKLTEQGKQIHYYSGELYKAQQKIRSYERNIAALTGEQPQDTDTLLAQLAVTELEVTRLKANRSRKDKQVRGWRIEVEFLHEYIAVLRGDPATKTPDRQWPPPSWRPTEEADPDAATVKELRAENERLQAENTYLKMERAKLNKAIDNLDAEIERLTEIEIAKEALGGDRDIVWVVIDDNESRNYFVFMEKADAEKFHRDCNAPVSLRAEPDANFDFTRCRLDDGEFVRGPMGKPQPPKRVKDYSEKITNPPPPPPQQSAASPWLAEPRSVSDLRAEPSAASRGRHFGAFPDPSTVQKIRGLTPRLGLDNTALLRLLIDNEYANPPDVLPPRRKRANRIHHFGAYPDQATWTKIRQLLERYRIDNTELLSYLVEKNQ
jgi:hypothetical protein